MTDFANINEQVRAKLEILKDACIAEPADGSEEITPQVLEEEVNGCVIEGAESVLLEYLQPETPELLLVAMLTVLQRKRRTKIHAAVTELVQTSPSEAVQAAAVSYVASSGLPSGVTFLEELAKSNDQRLRKLGQVGLKRVPKRKRLAATKPHSDEVMGIQPVQVDHLRGQDLEEPITAFKQVLAKAPLDLDRAFELCRTMTFEMVQSVIRYAGPTARATLLEAMLAGPEFQRLALGIIEQEPRIAGVLRARLASVVDGSEPEAGIRAFTLLRAAEVSTVPPAHHIKWLGQSDLVACHPDWVIHLALTYPDPCADSFALLPRDLRVRVVNAWAAKHMGDPIRHSVNRWLETLDQSHLAEEDAWEILEHAQKLTDTSLVEERLNDWVKRALACVAENPSHATLRRVALLARGMDKEAYLLAPTVLNALGEAQADLVIDAFVAGQGPQDVVRLLVRLMQRSKDRELVSIFKLAEQRLEQLSLQGDVKVAAAVIEAIGRDRRVQSLLMQSFPVEQVLDRGVRLAEEEAVSELVKRLLETPEGATMGIATLENTPRLLQDRTVAQALENIQTRLGRDLQVRADILLAHYGVARIPFEHAAWLEDASFREEHTDWVNLFVKQEGPDLALHSSLSEPARDWVLQSLDPQALRSLVLGQAVKLDLEGLTPERAVGLLRLATKTVSVLGSATGIADYLRPAVEVLARAHSSAGGPEGWEAVAQLGLEELLLTPVTLERLPDRTARTMTAELLATSSPSAQVGDLIRLLREAMSAGTPRTVRIAQDWLTAVCTENPGVLPGVLQSLQGTRLAEMLTDSFVKRFEQMAQETVRLEKALKQAQSDARRQLAKALGPTLEQLEIRLQDACPPEAAELQQQIRNLYANVRTSMTRAGLSPVEPTYTVVPFDWGRHKTVGSSPASGEYVTVRSLGICIEGEEEEPACPAYVIRSCEEDSTQ